MVILDLYFHYSGVIWQTLNLTGKSSPQTHAFPADDCLRTPLRLHGCIIYFLCCSCERAPQVTKKIADIYTCRLLFVWLRSRKLLQVFAGHGCYMWPSSNSCKVIILIFVVTFFRWRWSNSLKKQRNILVKDKWFLLSDKK